MRFVIFGVYQGSTEEIDCADCLADARYLVAEYQMAFGASWRVYYRKVRV